MGKVCNKLLLLIFVPIKLCSNSKKALLLDSRYQDLCRISSVTEEIYFAQLERST